MFFYYHGESSTKGGTLRPTIAQVDLSAIAYNIQSIKKQVHPAQVMAVVKAEAYGHGAVYVAQTAIQNGATYLGVAIVEEAIELRKNDIQTPILVFGGELENQLELFFKYNLEITVYTKK